MRILLLPISFLYAIILTIRNKLYDWHLLKTKRFSQPVIGVGNLSLGGTGKTPHTEYLVRLLHDTYSVCVISRGYGRKTRGFQLATPSCSSDTIGDEPMQLFSKFNDLQVAVDENRREALELMLSQDIPPQVFLLDDAFQHRRVTAGMNLLLTRYDRLYTEDFLIPTGTLRDVKSASKRADLVVVTQCPETLFGDEQALDKEIGQLRQRLRLLDKQALFLSSIHYEALRPVTHAARPLQHDKELSADTNCLCFTGIAHPEPLEKHLGQRFSKLQTIRFNDHHRYNEKDLQRIRNHFESLGSGPRILVTTEKDLARLTNSPYLCQFESLPLFVAPVKIFINKEEEFNKIIIDYVRKNHHDG